MRKKLLVLPAPLVALGQDAQPERVEFDEAFGVGLVVAAGFVEADERL